jgi:hypothetical protein
LGTLPFKSKAKNKLRPYDNEIPAAVCNRFLDLKEMFEEPLLHHLQKKKLDVRSIIFRLRCLGTDEVSAAPWIVVLCNPELVKEVRRYFNQRRVKEELRPDNQDLPSLQVIVEGRPLMTAASNEAMDAFGECWDSILESGTLCGARIKVTKDEQERYATIGGIIEVLGRDGIYRFYAMTAGHVLPDSSIADASVMGEADINDDYSTADTCSVHSDTSDDDLQNYEIDIPEFDHNWEPRVSSPATREGDEPATRDGGATPDEHSWSRIGNVLEYRPPLIGKHTGNLDWALIELDDKKQYLPNQAPGQKAVADKMMAGPSYWRMWDVCEWGIPPWGPSCVLNGRKPTAGVLNKEPAFVLLAPGQRLVKTSTVRLGEGKGK